MYDVYNVAYYLLMYTPSITWERSRCISTCFSFRDFIWSIHLLLFVKKIITIMNVFYQSNI